MAKTLNHYSQQIKALAPDAVALDRAKALGDLLIAAKAAVKAAGRLWGEWLETDCELSSRTAGRFMTIAKRWDEPAFTEARAANPSLAIREADKVLGASSKRKRAEPQLIKSAAAEPPDLSDLAVLYTLNERVYGGKNEEWRESYGRMMLGKAGSDAEGGCSMLVITVLMLQQNDLWRDYADDWDQFCCEYLGKPAEFVERIADAYRVLLEDKKQQKLDLAKAKAESDVDYSGRIAGSKDPKQKAKDQEAYEQLKALFEKPMQRLAPGTAIDGAIPR